MKPCVGTIIGLLVGALFMATNAHAASPQKDFDSLWEQVEKKISDGLANEAYAVVEQIYQSAEQAKDPENLARALYQLSRLKAGVYEYEKALEVLYQRPLPNDAGLKGLLLSYRAFALKQYYRMYRTDILARKTKLESTDFRQWSAEQVWQGCEQDLQAAWRLREPAGQIAVSTLNEYLQAGGYPEPSLRDFIGRTWAEHLEDQETWTPEQSEAFGRMDGKVLAVLEPELPAGTEISQPGLHPLQRMILIYNDLAAWHAGRQEGEAELNAKLLRVLAVQQAFGTDPEVKAAAIKTLRLLSENQTRSPWWSFLQYRLAQLLESDHQLVEAVRAAASGKKAFPNSLGAQLCTALIARIQAPAFGVQNEHLNPAQRGILTLTSRNLKRAFLRVYPLADPIPRVLRGSLSREQVSELLEKEKPVLELTQPLNDPGDHSELKTKVPLSLPRPGIYLVLGSVEKTFAQEANQLVQSFYVVTDLGLVSRREQSGAYDFYSVSTVNGRPVPDAQLEFYDSQWQNGKYVMRLTKQGRTNAQGTYTLTPPLISSYVRYTVVVRKDQQVAWLPQEVNPYRYNQQREDAVFIYTDRAIYRPEQEVKFKLLAVRTQAEKRQYQVRPEVRFKLQAHDPNGEVFATVEVKTNAWGSASGAIKIPKGRVLGAYYLAVEQREESATGGQFQVEEYKVPKFQVVLDGPRSAMRLEQAAELLGHAEYYYGGPVKHGKVQYQITREPIYPFWYFWFNPFRVTRTGAEPVARGVTTTDEQGKFTLKFLPAAVSNLKLDKSVRYDFRFAVSVTDEAGDTLSTSQAYPIGRVSLVASIDLPEGYPVADQVFALKVNLQDLTGKPRAGKGTLEIYPLLAPPETLPPAEAREQNLLFHDSYAELAALKPGTKLKTLALKHDDQGLAEVTGLGLPVGVYLLEYRSTDPFGETVEAKQFVRVAPLNAQTAAWPLSLDLAASNLTATVGSKVRFLVASGLAKQHFFFELLRNGVVVHRQTFDELKARQLEFLVPEEWRGGFTARVFGVHNYRLYDQSLAINVPWDNKELKVTVEHLRKIMAPGVKESVTLKVIAPQGVPARAEVLAVMYDQALEYFVRHSLPALQGLFPGENSYEDFWSNQLRQADVVSMNWYSLPGATEPTVARFEPFEYGYPSEGFYNASEGAPVPRRPSPKGGLRAQAASVEKAKMSRAKDDSNAPLADMEQAQTPGPPPAEPGAASAPLPGVAPALRKNFQETAFFEPQLVLDKDGSVSFTFQVPDSLTTWNVKVMAHGQGLESGQVNESVKTQKDFMVRPYLPRFVREGDEIVVRTAIDNKTDHALEGELRLRIENEKGEDVTASFKPQAVSWPWKTKAQESVTPAFSLKAPRGLGLYRIKLSAQSGNLADGEERPLPLLPSRMHLLESRFAVLKDTIKKTLTLEGLKASAQDPSLVHESLVVTVDGQLIYSVLKALPYLYQYPYECVEQTLNRFYCMALVHGTFTRYPSLAKMAKQFSERKVPMETWDQVDPNRKTALEETPWMDQAQGGEAGERYANVLDPRVVKAQSEESLNKLVRAQLSDGGFPWFPGGPGDFYITLYVLSGLARAQEAGVTIPQEMIGKALDYCQANYRKWLNHDWDKDGEGDLPLAAYLNYMLSSYENTGFKAKVAAFDRDRLFQICLKYWQRLSPYGRAMLAITLQRHADTANAQKVLNSLLDVAKTTENEGTYWAPEAKAWLWYNDTIETHAFILLAMLEVKPEDPRTDGMALWLLRNKKGNQWKSTKASALAMTALVAYLAKHESLEVLEKVEVSAPPLQQSLTWEPGVFSGKQQMVVPLEKISPQSAVITLDKTGKGYMFASATWQYSTEKLPDRGQGDVLAVDRKFYRVVTRGRDQALEPLAASPGTDAVDLKLGDEIEVELNLSAKTPMTYIHLRDPRGAGFEPEESLSGYRWEQVLGYYEEVRDSATNFFFDWLPQGTYTFRYRIRAANAGRFRVGPATVQSMYAPEFGAFSSGRELKVE